METAHQINKVDTAPDELESNYQVIANGLYSYLNDNTSKLIYDAGFASGNHEKSKNKTEVLVDRAKILSKDKNYFNPLEWKISALIYTNKRYSCACGKPNLQKAYMIKNEYTNQMMAVGSSCLKHHFLLEPREDIFDYLRRSASSPSSVYLGKKYNAFVLSVLGYKKASKYFCSRDNKSDISKEIVDHLRQGLSRGLERFDAAYWEKRLTRGNDLKYHLEYAKRRELAARQTAKRREREKAWIEKQKKEPGKPAPIHDESAQSYTTAPTRKTHFEMIEEIDPFAAFQNRIVEGDKYAITISNSNWRCTCGGEVTQWGHKGGKPYMVCNDCINEYIVDSDIDKEADDLF